MSRTQIDALIDQGLCAQAANQLPEAEQAYSQALQLDPDDPDALHLLGLVLHQTGRAGDAIGLLTAAVVLAPDEAVFHFNLGEALRSMGIHEKAVERYAEALRLDRGLKQAHLPLAESLAALGKADAVEHLRAALSSAVLPADLLRIARCARATESQELAIEAATRAVESAPTDPAALQLLAPILDKAHRYEPLPGVYRRLIEWQPREEYFVGLASAYAEIRDYSNAERAAREGLARYPKLTGAIFVLGHCADRQDDVTGAIGHYKAVIALDPAHVPSRVNLAIALRTARRHQESMEELLEAQKWDAGNFEVVCNIAMTQKELGRVEEAILGAREALKIKPGDRMATNFLAVMLHEKKRSREAAELLEEHVAKCPDDRDSHCNLGIVYLDRGQIEAAYTHFRRALEIDPRNAGIYSNLLLTATYDDELTPQALYDLHVDWATTQEKPSPPAWPIRAPGRRKIRVGYVSPDFRTHSVVFFSCPVLMHHNRAEFEVFCYSDVQTPDKVTRLLQTFGHQWREIEGLPHEKCFRMIQEDGIDILVDIAGHTAGNRLALFGARPAPIQVSLIGYPNTTGLTAMDYQITDAILHPVDAPHALATEKLVRLPDVFACYRPPENAPSVAPLPAIESGHITFAYFNNLAKLRPFMLRAWGEIARQVPGSRFILQTTALADKLTCEFILGQCREAGLPVDRVELKGQSSLSQFHSDLHTVDIGLDPYPFNGHTTSCQILHMGVPIVTLAGATRSSRMGASLLTNLGLPELIAHTPAEYVKIAVDLARDLPRLGAIRASLRGRMESSAIVDGARYTRHLEDAYRRMWDAARAPAP